MFAEVVQHAPVLHQSTATGPGFGQVNDSGMWCAWEGPRGAAIGYSCFPNGDASWVLSAVSNPFLKARPPYRTSMIALGSADSDVAEILDSSDLVPIWDLPGPEHLRQADVPLSLAYLDLVDALHAELLARAPRSSTVGC